jgi:hypothetical protein
MEVEQMNTKRNRRALAVVAMMIVVCVAVSVQSNQTGDGEWINFPNTTVGQTMTIPFTYTCAAASETSAQVTVTPPSSPFGVGGPLSFSLAPGQSRTLNVTFAPPQAGDYEDAFTITAVGGLPIQVLITYVTVTGQGAATSSDEGATTSADEGAATSADQPDAPSLSWILPTFLPTDVTEPAFLPTDTTGPTDTLEESPDFAIQEAKLDRLGADLMDMWNDLAAMWEDMLDEFQDVQNAIWANGRAIQALQDENEQKLDELLLWAVPGAPGGAAPGAPGGAAPGTPGGAAPASQGGTAMGTGVVDYMDCTMIGFSVYQRGGQWLMDVFGLPGAIPVNPNSPPPYPLVRVDVSWNSTFQECNTNSSGAFGTEGIVLTKFEVPFYIDVRYRDSVTLNWSAPCRIDL